MVSRSFNFCVNFCSTVFGIIFGIVTVILASNNIETCAGETALPRCVIAFGSLYIFTVLVDLIKEPPKAIVNFRPCLRLAILTLTFVLVILLTKASGYCEEPFFIYTVVIVAIILMAFALDLLILVYLLTKTKGPIPTLLKAIGLIRVLVPIASPDPPTLIRITNFMPIGPKTPNGNSTANRQVNDVKVPMVPITTVVEVTPPSPRLGASSALS